MRTATRKFVDNTNDMPELYDLMSDPEEIHNVADEYPDQVTAMRDRLKHCFLPEGHGSRTIEKR